ncbi:MAG TPA: hypothetical protein VFE59_26865 [Trebonia sp.]|jgi:hypothetical protein|nr:hypothetical protein [Trebonia sp.]
MTPGATTNLWTAVLSDLTRQAAQQLELQLGSYRDPTQLLPEKPWRRS